MNELAGNLAGEHLIDSCYEKNFSLVRAYVNGGVSVDYRSPKNGDTPVQVLCLVNGPEILRYVLENGADASLIGNGCTPLEMAVLNNRYECIALLVEYNVALDAVNSLGQTALWYASSKGYLPIVELLVNAGADAKADNTGKTPLAAAAENGHGAVAAFLTLDSID